MFSPHRLRLFLFCCAFHVYSLVYTQTAAKPGLEKEAAMDLPAATKGEIDSLRKLINIAPPGREKLKLYGNMSWAYSATRTHLETARLYADSMFAAAGELANEEMLAKSHFYYGVIARHQGDFSNALAHLKKYLAYNQIHGDSIKVASALFQVGVINHDMGNYDKSLATYYRILAIWKKENSFYDVATTLNSIAIILKKTKHFDDAIRIYHEAMNLFDSLDAPDRGYVRTNIGNLYAETGDFEKAFTYYRQALRVHNEYGDKVEAAVCLQNIGSLYNKLAKHDSALSYHLMSFAILEHTPQQWEIAQGLQHTGHTYLQLKNYAAAESHLQRSLAIAKPLKARPLIRDTYYDLSSLYAAKKDFAAAYRYHQLYASLKDSVLNETTTAQLNELQVKYEAGEKDKQIQLLAKEKEIQQKEAARQSTLKKAFIAGLLLVCMLAILVVYVFRQRLKNQRMLAAKNNELREADFSRQKTELEMKALRAQINPHFLFNCMNSINHLIIKGDTINASSYLTKFSKLLRLILENGEAHTVSLRSELDLLRSYIELEALRFKGRISYQISVDADIEPDSTYLPSMVLQPFVENAIWHGLMQKEESETGKLTIDVKEKNDSILCTIEDNGVGREKAAQLRNQSVLERKSFGMKITEDRLRLMSNGRRQEFIYITDLKDGDARATGTRIEINIPIS
jgi:tetratricopeptide (TPR) repeat protein